MSTQTNEEINDKLALLLAEKEIQQEGEVGEFTPQQWLVEHPHLWVDYCNDWKAMEPLIRHHAVDIEWPEVIDQRPVNGCCCVRDRFDNETIHIEEFEEDGGMLKAATICIIEDLERDKRSIYRQFNRYKQNNTKPQRH